MAISPTGKIAEMVGDDVNNAITESQNEKAVEDTQVTINGMTPEEQARVQREQIENTMRVQQNEEEVEKENDFAQSSRFAELEQRLNNGRDDYMLQQQMMHEAEPQFGKQRFDN